ncbi:Putative membrane protein [Candidatus Glomeribacter gigasporarum BEG34]|uniref:Putative membrane protein n=1 Tax=Candidatus Glomeribacter gigasporarum BEG34 TaxID=1070319 RepID=G2J8Q7_9BURK|nr:hypothetical protein [Candidatus Glomeribacter gigasporarum]CCD29154.1 Putative membrane protein [Candidatus Glomeribacter gigasporarum BEG34]
MKPAIVRLTASVTPVLPRWMLRAICVVYALSGLWGRDPWKNEDAAGFGVMWTLAEGGWHDWLFPNLLGKAITGSGPLGYWPGAASIRLFAFWLTPADAARIATALLFCIGCAFVWYSADLLGRRSEVQPFKYAFGGEPAPRDYGRTIADGALLILLACFGLAERGHETTPEVMQFACVSMWLYGWVRSLDCPVQGALWWGGALGLLALASSPPLAVALLAGSLLWMLFTREFRPAFSFRLGIAIALGVMVLWLGAAWSAFPENTHHYLRAWSAGGVERFNAFSARALIYALKNLPLFAWPAWPLAAWSWYCWPGLRRAPHIALPLSVILPLLALIGLQTAQTNRLFLLLLPALSILAAFGLPTLKRGAMNAMDWFAILSFTGLSAFVWMVWLAAQTGFPPPLARNLGRLVPGFQAHFNASACVIALCATGCWMLLVRWRLACHPKALWRSVVLSSAGTTLMWVLLTTLWLPFVNYGRTYREVAARISAHLPAGYHCIRPVRLGDAQLASFAYFGRMRFSFDNPACDTALRQSARNAPASRAFFSDFPCVASRSPYCAYCLRARSLGQSTEKCSSLSPQVWQPIWEGHRPADRDERFQLYLRVDRAP